MKQKANPVIIAVAVVVLIGFLVVLFRNVFPPEPPPDTANPGGMPEYAKKFLEQKKKGLQPAGTYPGMTSQSGGQSATGGVKGN